MNATHPPSRIAVLRTSGAILAYGCLAAFLVLISLQIFRWFREGEWTHIGITDLLRTVLGSCCANAESTGALTGLAHWLDAPTDWLGWHKVLEVIPASIGLFALSMLGNFAFVYASDRLQDRQIASSDRAA
jgi:tellurite resistance protein TehA-like permease